MSHDPEIYPGLNGKVRYAEGVFIGYRHYDRAGIAPLFPFGHGLSYTSFELDGFDGKVTSNGATVRLTVTNTGDRIGSTVVQIYVGDAEASLSRPLRELKAFRKIELNPGQTRELCFELPPRAFAFFDTGKRCWRVEAGEFKIFAGFSAGDLRTIATVTLPGQCNEV